MSKVLLLVAVLISATIVAGCSDESVSPAFERYAQGGWQPVIDEASFHSLMLTRLLASPAPRPNCVGRGIAVWVESPAMVSWAWTIVSQLRTEFQSSLPVEIWHAGSITTKSEFETSFEGVTVRDLLSVVDSVRSVASPDGQRMAAQPLVIMHSRFAEVLYVDALTVPTADPATLFDLPAYQASGILMWSTPFTISSGNPYWSLSSERCRDVDNWDQSGSLLLINKEQQWEVLSLAEKIRANDALDFIFDGDNNVFRLAASIGRVNITDAHIAVPPTPLGAFYTIKGERQWCTNSLSFVGGFISNLNAEVLVAGATVDDMKCFEGIAQRRVNEISSELSDKLIRAYQTAPATTAVPNACSVRLTEAQIEAILRNRPSEMINIDKFSVGMTVDYTISQGARTRDCGDWFRCGAYGWNNMDLWIKWYNVSSTKSAQIDVRTKSSRNRGLGNDTFIQVINHGGSHQACDYPTPGSTETHVSFFNMYSRSWFMIGVAWGPPKAQTRTTDIVLSVRYNGPVSMGADGEDDEVARDQPIVATA